MKYTLLLFFCFGVFWTKMMNGLQQKQVCICGQLYQILSLSLLSCLVRFIIIIFSIFCEEFYKVDIKEMTKKTWEVFWITLIPENRERSYRVAQKKTRDVNDI